MTRAHQHQTGKYKQTRFHINVEAVRLSSANTLERRRKTPSSWIPPLPKSPLRTITAFHPRLALVQNSPMATATGEGVDMVGLSLRRGCVKVSFSCTSLPFPCRAETLQTNPQEIHCIFYLKTFYEVSCCSNGHWPRPGP